MRNSKRKTHISSHRGFTVLEVVIALTVIVIVSASAFALIHSHIKLEHDSIQRIEATNIAENAIECFRFAKDEAEFKIAYEAVVRTEDLQITLSETNAENSIIYEYTDGALEVTFIIVDNQITINITGNSGTIIDNQTYTKYVNK